MVGDIQVVGDVAWSTDTPVGIAACAAAVQTPDGNRSVHAFTFGAGPGRDMDIATLESSPPPGSPVQVRCEQYASPEQLDPSYWSTRFQG